MGANTARLTYLRGVYGLPEKYRDQIAGPKSSGIQGVIRQHALALMPLVEAKALRESHVIVDGKSGASGAGRSAVPILLLLRHPIISMPTRPRSSP